MTTQDFSDHLDCLFDASHEGRHRIPGPSFTELLHLFQSGTYCDDVDRLYIDFDACGGE